jgi:hypothetical protein
LYSAIKLPQIVGGSARLGNVGTPLIARRAFAFVQNRFMDSSEREIFDYLKTWGADFVNAKEVCRRASSKKRYATDPDWARPIMQRMKERNILEGDSLGRYRIKPLARKKHGGRWVSPDIKKILNESGIAIDIERADAASDDHYEQL